MSKIDGLDSFDKNEIFLDDDDLLVDFDADIKYFWEVKFDNEGKTEKIEWDSITKTMLGPASIHVIVENLISDKTIVWLTPTGPKLEASLGDHLAAWGTIQEAIELSGYTFVDGSPCPVEIERDPGE